MPEIAPVVVLALIVGIGLAFAAIRRASREASAGKGSVKESLESTKLILEIGAIGAGAIWLLNTFYSSELDVHRGRSVSVPIKVDAAFRTLSGHDACRLVATWGVKNEGTKNQFVELAELRVWKYDPAAFPWSGTGYVEPLSEVLRKPPVLPILDVLKDECALEKAVDPKACENADAHLVRPGQDISWSRAVVVPFEENMLYWIEGRIRLKGESEPWLLSSVAYCSKPAPSAPTSVAIAGEVTVSVPQLTTSTAATLGRTSGPSAAH